MWKKRCLFGKEEQKLAREEERPENERGSFRKSGDDFIVLQVLAHTRLMFSWFS